MQLRCAASLTSASRLSSHISLYVNSYVAKNKLRLIRLCKVLLPAGSIVEMAVNIGATVALEAPSLRTRIQQKGRLLLRELVDPNSSPICAAQHSIVELMDSFGVEEGQWVLLKCLGVDYVVRGCVCWLGAHVCEYRRGFCIASRNDCLVRYPT